MGTDTTGLQEAGTTTGHPGSAVPLSSPESVISWKYLAISVLLSFAAMAVVVHLTYTPGVLEHLKPKRLPGLGIAIAVSLLRVVVAGARLRYLSDRRLTWLASFRLILTWDFASAVTPSTIGGAPFATYAMTKEGIPLGKSTIIVLYGVFLDQIWYAVAVPILLLSGIWFAVVPAETGWVGQFTMLLIYTALVGYGVLLAYGLLINPKSMRRFIVRVFSLPLLRRFKAKVESEAEHLESYSKELRLRPARFMVNAFALTVLSWLCRIALPVIVVLSLLPADELLLVLRSLSMHLAFLVVPTPGGSGGVEGLFFLFIGPLIEREAFVGLAIFAWRIISYYISVGLGVMAGSWYLNSANHRTVMPAGGRKG